MVSFEEQQRVLHSPFNLEVHRKTFINYLEIIILPDGTPEYAVPSHMMKLAKVYGKSMDEVYEEFERESLGLDGIDFLCHKTHCVAVWNDRIQGMPNAAQRATLLWLNDAGVYRGIPELCSDLVIKLPENFRF